MHDLNVILFFGHMIFILGLNDVLSIDILVLFNLKILQRMGKLFSLILDGIGLVSLT